MKCHLTPLKMSVIKEKRKMKMISIGKDVEKLESLFIADRNVK